MKALFRTDYLICQKITIIKVHVPGPDYALAAVHIEQPRCRLVSLCGDLDRFDDCTPPSSLKPCTAYQTRHNKGKNKDLQNSALVMGRWG